MLTACQLDFPSCLASPRRRHDQISFEGRGFDLEWSKQTADIAPATCFVGYFLEPASHPRLPFGCRLLGRSRGLEIDLLPNPLHLGAQPADLLGGDRATRVEAQPNAELRQQRVGEAARFRQGDRESCGVPTRLTRKPAFAGSCQQAGIYRGVQASPDQGGHPLPFRDACASRVPCRGQQLVPVRHGLPQSHRERDVSGELSAVPSAEGRLIKLVELPFALVPPMAKSVQVDHGGLRFQGHAQMAGRRGCTGPPGGGRAGHAHGFLP